MSGDQVAKEMSRALVGVISDLMAVTGSLQRFRAILDDTMDGASSPAAPARGLFIEDGPIFYCPVCRSWLSPDQWSEELEFDPEARCVCGAIDIADYTQTELQELEAMLEEERDEQEA